MTPLAHRIVKELTLPIKRRRFNDELGLLKMMDDIHCFDCTAIYETANWLSSDIHTRGINDEFIFLPAPKTWIEISEPYTARLDDEDEPMSWVTGYLMIEGTQDEITVISALQATKVSTGEVSFGSHERFVLNKKRAVRIYGPRRIDYARGVLEDIDDDDYNYWICERLCILLAMINTPHIVNRTKHNPHRGLERDLIAKRRVIGSFPLHAWTEILLDISPPKELVDSGEVEPHLTGKRALHFVRAHLRLWQGKMIWVKSHHRGDASIGIKQSRYKLTDRSTNMSPI